MSLLALAAVSAAVSDVRAHIAISERRVDAVRELLSTNTQLPEAADAWVREVAAFRAGRKFDYACAVILLYGALERFLEDAAEEHLSALSSSVNRYSDLPEKLRGAHFTQVLAHLQRTRDSRYDGRATASQLAQAFASCLQDATPFEFLAESMLHHTANFRPQAVDDYLGRIGVESSSRRAVRSDVFAAYLDASGKAIAEDRPEAALDLIADLVSRRNEVAHGVVLNILGPSELIPYCDQVLAYCGGLANVLENALLEHLVRFYGVDHGKPVAVHNHNIVCIQSKGVVLRRGDRLVIQNADGLWYSCKIKSVQVEGVEVEATSEGADIAVGLLIDGRCKASYVVKSGVFELVVADEPYLQVEAGADDPEPVGVSQCEVRLWRERCEEAQHWVRRNQDGPSVAWLNSEYARCCAGLASAGGVGQQVEDRIGDLLPANATA